MVFNTIYIVSGLQRSGTSLMMQMLEKAGLDVYIDNKRKPDQFNPNGYYEHSNIYNIKSDNHFFYDCIGRVVKLYAAGIYHLPKGYNYKVLFLDRDIHEIWLSMRASNIRLKRSTKERVLLSTKLNNVLRVKEKALEWIKDQDNIDILEVQYQDLLINTMLTCQKVKDFLEIPIQTNLMIQAVNHQLYTINDLTDTIRIDRAPKTLYEVIERHSKDKIFCEIGIGEGDNLNMVSNAKHKFGVEIAAYGVQRCHEKYPNLEVIHGSIFNVIDNIDFDVCYMWLTYPKCEEVVDVIIKRMKERNLTIILGLNYYYHLKEEDDLYKRYINAYAPIAKADKWNLSINNHLDKLNKIGYSITIEQVSDSLNNEVFSLAIIRN